MPLTVFPVEHLAHCPMPMARFLELALGDLVVLHVEPALLRPPGDRLHAMVGEPGQRWARCCGSWHCAARAANCCPKSPGRRPTASRRA